MLRYTEDNIEQHEEQAAAKTEQTNLGCVL